jgi:hypothetical protein
VRARFADDDFVMLAEPRYSVRKSPTATLVKIDYALPGASSGALGRGVIELERTPDGRLSALGGRFVDLRTGSTRVPLKPGPLERAFSLGRCAPKKA